MSLFSTLAEYFMYIVAMHCCSEDGEFFDEGFL
jgi:hypothetical protein